MNNLLWFTFDDIVNIEVPTEIEKKSIADILAKVFEIDFDYAERKIMTPLKKMN